jgi:hypothetical protein
MNDARTTRRIDSARGLRAQRGAEAAVAQYIHELSVRHAGTGSGGRAVPGHPRRENGADHVSESQEAREALAPTR